MSSTRSLTMWRRHRMDQGGFAHQRSSVQILASRDPANPLRRRGSQHGMRITRIRRSQNDRDRMAFGFGGPGSLASPGAARLVGCPIRAIRDIRVSSRRRASQLIFWAKPSSTVYVRRQLQGLVRRRRATRLPRRTIPELAPQRPREPHRSTPAASPQPAAAPRTPYNVAASRSPTAPCGTMPNS
jgi:hypothetical protein